MILLTRSQQWLVMSMAIASIALTGNSLSAHETPDGTPHSEEPGEHSHDVLEIPAGQPVPTVRLTVMPDSVRGWNLHANVTNFRFAPERVNTKSLTTEGHAHLMIDGQKVTRLYGSWYYIPRLEPGKHTIAVMLNSNAHDPLMHNGKPIAAVVEIDVPPNR